MDKKSPCCCARASVKFDTSPAMRKVNAAKDTGTVKGPVNEMR